MVARTVFLVSLLGACLAVVNAQSKCSGIFCPYPTVCSEVRTNCGRPNCPTHPQCVRASRPPRPGYGCAAVFCAQGTVCEEITAACFSPPCPSQPVCVPLQSGGKLSYCPRENPFWGSQPCFWRRDYCRTDVDCSGSLKCCSRRCGKTCVYPSSSPAIG